MYSADFQIGELTVRHTSFVTPVGMTDGSGEAPAPVRFHPRGTPRRPVRYLRGLHACYERGCTRVYQTACRSPPPKLRGRRARAAPVLGHRQRQSARLQLHYRELQ